MDKIKILIACEESQTVCIAFRKLGFEAFSCDIMPCSGGHPEWHIQDDALKHLNDGWDLMIAFPPCTYLTNTGNRWRKIPGRNEKSIEAYKFFFKLWNCNIPKICIENPVGTVNHYFQPAQIIQPWMFGEKFQKRTCLWLFNLPELIPTNIVDKGEFIYAKNGKRMPKWYSDARWDKKKRSKTFPGIAEAMAKQWGDYLNGTMPKKN